MQVLNGFVKIHRKLLQWGWYQDNVVKGVFLHLLLTASFKDSWWMGREIKRGQVVIGLQNMANELGFTRQQVRTAINKLKSTNEITTETTNKFTIVTVVNWEEYQILEEDATNEITNTLTNEQPTSNQQITNNQPHRKNVKKEKNVKNIYKKEKGETDFDRLISDFSQNGDLQLAIYEFIKMRKGIKSPLTTHALELILKKLSSLASEDGQKIAILNQSIENGWRGVFELKTSEKGTSEGNRGKYSNFDNRKDVDYDEIERASLRKRLGGDNHA